MKNVNTGRLGFTLIELLVVVLIIGILSAVALPQYQKAVEKSRASEGIQNIMNIQRAVEMWVLSNGGLPSTNTFLIGCKEKADGKCGVLDIDLESVLTCSTSQNNCESKNFQYTAYCNSSSCAVNVSRMRNNRYIYGFIMSDWNPSNLSWWKDCEYNLAFPEARTICQSLEAQGWSLSDYSDL